MRRTHPPCAAALALLAATACSSVAPVERAVALPTPSTAPDAPPPRPGANDPVLLWVRALPADVSVDGAVEDWELEPGADVVSVGIAPDRVVLAVAWAGEKRPVVSLALATLAPPLPSIGWSQRGGSTHELTPETCAYEQIPLIEAGWQNGNPHPPEVTEACLGVLARYEEQSLAYRERFVRRIRIEGETVSLLDREGKPRPLAGAKVRARGSSAEIELPLGALPDLDQAPLEHLVGGVAFGELPTALRTGPQRPPSWSDEPPKLDEAWALLALDAPVAFGPQADLLAAAFDDASGSLGGAVMSQMSYAPAKPGTVLTISVPDVAVPRNDVAPNVPGAIGGPTAPDRPALSLSEEPLVVPLETFDRVSVVLALGSVATLLDGKLVTRTYFSRPDGTQRRGTALHLFRYEVGGFNWSTGFQPPTWRVLGIQPDGRAVEAVADEGPDWPGMHDAWDDDPTTFHAADWTSFGMRGKRKGRPRVMTWRWDAAASRYVVSVQPPTSFP